MIQLSSSDVNDKNKAATPMQIKFRGFLVFSILVFAGFPLDLENLENLEKGEYTWKTWKYHGILKKLINIMENYIKPGKILSATKNLPLNQISRTYYTI